MNEDFGAVQEFGSWLERTNLLTVVIFLGITIFIITMLVRLYKHIHKFVKFVDMMQSLPTFMDQTNAKFLVLFDHLQIDPDESRKYETFPEVPE